MVYIISPELVGTGLITAIKEEFPSPQDLFNDLACTKTTLRILMELLRCRGINVDCRQGVKVVVGVSKAYLESISLCLPMMKL